MCIRTTSAKQSDKSEIVCSTAYRILGEVTYLSLVLTFFAVSAFKNKHDNFVYGNTGLIFKSSLEKYIVAREGLKGKWLPLDEYDIAECKRLGLRWKKIQNKIKGETTNLEVLKKYDLFPKLSERDKNEYRLIDVDEDNENNEN